MSGIYIHIPFCKKACHYCNFHFSTSLQQKEAVVAAITKEIDLQKDYLPSTKIDTVYFGGGTPSLLTIAELNQIFDQLHKTFSLSPTLEVTLEANPDDLSLAKLKDLYQTPVNRLSIGIQSFSEKDLVFMNRSHNAIEAKNCIENAQQVGFDNLTIDLIYGSPTTSIKEWEENLAQTFSFQIPHISAYCLTVEPKTALAHMVKTGKVKPIDDELAAQHFDILIKQTNQQGYQHYETSNFALKNWESKHNSSYWKGKPYVGIGPAAHSFNGQSRQWNVANNSKYLKAIQQNNLSFELEHLSITDRFNEYIMTSLRTMWGCDLEKIKQDFGEKYAIHLQNNIATYTTNALMIQEKNTLFLTSKGKFVADGIISTLFYD